MSSTTHDVFLSYIPTDAGTASVVDSALSAAGLQVFRAWDISLGTELKGAVLEALIESKALVALISPLSINSSNIAFELGMAMSWRKPIYLLLDSVQPDQLFSGARNFHVHPVSELPQVIAAIKRHLDPLTEEERQRLTQLYQEFQLPTDRLLTNPAALDELATRFRRLGGRQLSGERLGAELLRLRKSGQLPRLRVVRSRPQSSKGAA